MLTERLGAARGTTLYRAVRPESAKEPVEVVMRVADRLDDAAAVEAVRAEYDVLRALDDPRVPRVHGFYPGQAAIALSWCGGVTLAEVLAAARDHAIELDASTALDLSAEIAAALRAAHGTVVRGAPVVHGHLDPTRVQLDGEGHLSVVGLVRLDDRPGYTPPEQAAGRAPTPASDQWTLGALIVEMLLGRRVYDGLDDPTAAVLDGAVEPWVAPIDARIPSLARTLRKMLSPTPEERLASDGEVVQALLASARETGGVSGRTSVVAAVLQRRALLAHRPDPVPMPDARLTLNVLRLAQDSFANAETAPPDDEVPRAEEPDDPEDPFPDSPTSPDGYGLLSDVMFSDEVTDPHQTGTNPSGPVEEGELDDQSVTGLGPRVTGPVPPPAPAPTGAPLLASERLGLVLAVVLAALALVFVVSRAL